MNLVSENGGNGRVMGRCVLAFAVFVVILFCDSAFATATDDHGGEHGVSATKQNAVQSIQEHKWLLITATVIFGIAVMHTFAVGRFQKIAHVYPEGSIGENVFHLLGEVEAVFLLWSAILIAVIAWSVGWSNSVSYIDSRNYTEPTFVFVIMAIAATRPVIDAVDFLIRSFSKVLFFLPSSIAFFFSVLTIGPLLGSFVTEPAAMTVTAFVLKRQYYDRGLSRTFMYAILGALFVNVSIGGVLTHYAAPPVLMVASTWGWDQDPTFMIRNFGYKAVLAVVITTSLLSFAFRKELNALSPKDDSDDHTNGNEPEMTVPLWVIAVHLVFIAFTVMNSHHPKMFLGGFLFFLAFTFVTQEFQERLKLRESLLVGGFLAGLVTLGGLQQWWLEPLIGSLSELPLFVGATGLTAITDNAALTYLGSLVPNLADSMKYSLVAGAVTGGGLTVIANAPNPAGYSVLNSCFRDDDRSVMGISPIGLLIAAIGPTLIAGICLWCLPTL